MSFYLPIIYSVCSEKISKEFSERKNIWDDNKIYKIQMAARIQILHLSLLSPRQNVRQKFGESGVIKFWQFPGSLQNKSSPGKLKIL